MKQTLKELQTHVEAKAKTFGEYSPYPISCDDLLWLIRQVEAAQHSVHPTGSNVCKICGFPDGYHDLNLHYPKPASG